MGQRFAGRYELVDLLGEGGGGSVWRAWDHRAGRYLAAKMLRQRDAGALLRFVREQSLRVAHPHVVAPTGWAAEDDDVLLTMDLVAGGSLATLLGDYGGLPVPVVVPMLDQLLDALGAVHAAGLVHRDVKPGNLLLEPTGTAPPFVRLADFGISVALGDPRLTELGSVMGTAGYVAPEVMRGADPDLRQDLWSVGVVARQLLTAERPALDGVRAAPVQGLQPALLDWLAWVTDADPTCRPANATTAREGLPTVLRGETEDIVEVFDHLAQLPRGWTPSGPTGSAGAMGRQPAGGPQASRYGPGRTQPWAPLWGSGSQGLALPGQPVRAGAAQADRTQVPTGREGAAAATAGAGGPPADADAAGRPLPARRVTTLGPARLGLVAVLLLLAVALFSLAATNGSPAPADPPNVPSAPPEPTGSLVGQTCPLQGSRVVENDAAVVCRAGAGGLRWTRE